MAAVVGATARLFVWPATNRPAAADAIVVLGGAGQRVQEGLALAWAGYAPVLVLSTTTPVRPQCVPPIPGVEIICFHADPNSTRGEARYLAAMASARHWRRTIVVTTIPQDTRARLRIGRCYHGGLLVVPAHLSLGRRVAATVYEWGALAKALVLQPGC